VRGPSCERRLAPPSSWTVIIDAKCRSLDSLRSLGMTE
jgi:hypothetical protein